MTHMLPICIVGMGAETLLLASRLPFIQQNSPIGQFIAPERYRNGIYTSRRINFAE